MNWAKGDPVEMLAPYLASGMTVVDVGAATGEVTKRLLEIVGPTGRVIAIEPDPRSVAVFPQAENVTLLPVACGADRDPRAAFAFADPATQSTLFPGLLKVSASHQAQVPTTARVCRLDDLVSKPDAIKVDAQGADALVLRGASRLLRTCPTWVVELWPQGLAAAATSARDITDPLWAAGYTIRNADGVTVTPELVDTWANAAGHRHVNVVAHRE